MLFRSHLAARDLRRRETRVPSEGDEITRLAERHLPADVVDDVLDVAAQETHALLVAASPREKALAHPDRPEPIALKVLPRYSSARVRSRFRQEAEALRRLEDHPGIARIHEAGIFETEHGPLPQVELTARSRRDASSTAPGTMQATTSIKARLARCMASASKERGAAAQAA